MAPPAAPPEAKVVTFSASWVAVDGTNVVFFGANGRPDVPPHAAARRNPTLVNFIPLD